MGRKAIRTCSVGTSLISLGVDAQRVAIKDKGLLDVAYNDGNMVNAPAAYLAAPLCIIGYQFFSHFAR